jgi:hypothetical protein
MAAKGGSLPIEEANARKLSEDGILVLRPPVAAETRRVRFLEMQHWEPEGVSS